MVVINAAAAIYLSNRADSLEEGIRMAQYSIDEGHAMKKLDNLVQMTNQ